MIRVTLFCATLLGAAAPLSAQEEPRPADLPQLTPPKHVVAPKPALPAPAVAPVKAPRVKPPTLRIAPKAAASAAAVPAPRVLAPPKVTMPETKSKVEGER